MVVRGHQKGVDKVDGSSPKGPHGGPWLKVNDIDNFDGDDKNNDEKEEEG